MQVLLSEVASVKVHQQLMDEDIKGLKDNGRALTRRAAWSRFKGVREVGTYHLPKVHKTSAAHRHTVTCQLRKHVLENGVSNGIC